MNPFRQPATRPPVEDAPSRDWTLSDFEKRLVRSRLRRQWAADVWSRAVDTGRVVVAALLIFGGFAGLLYTCAVAQQRARDCDAAGGVIVRGICIDAKAVKRIP